MGVCGVLCRQQARKKVSFFRGVFIALLWQGCQHNGGC